MDFKLYKKQMVINQSLILDSKNNISNIINNKQIKTKYNSRDQIKKVKTIIKNYKQNNKLVKKFTFSDYKFLDNLNVSFKNNVIMKKNLKLQKKNYYSTVLKTNMRTMEVLRISNKYLIKKINKILPDKFTIEIRNEKALALYKQIMHMTASCLYKSENFLNITQWLNKIKSLQKLTSLHTPVLNLYIVKLLNNISMYKNNLKQQKQYTIYLSKVYNQNLELDGLFFENKKNWRYLKWTGQVKRFWSFNNKIKGADQVFLHSYKDYLYKQNRAKKVNLIEKNGIKFNKKKRLLLLGYNLREFLKYNQRLSSYYNKFNVNVPLIKLAVYKNNLQKFKANLNLKVPSVNKIKGHKEKKVVTNSRFYNSLQKKNSWILNFIVNNKENSIQKNFKIGYGSIKNSNRKIRLQAALKHMIHMLKLKSAFNYKKKSYLSFYKKKKEKNKGILENTDNLFKYNTKMYGNQVKEYQQNNFVILTELMKHKYLTLQEAQQLLIQKTTYFQFLQNYYRSQVSKLNCPLNRAFFTNQTKLQYVLQYFYTKTLTKIKNSWLVMQKFKLINVQDLKKATTQISLQEILSKGYSIDFFIKFLLQCTSNSIQNNFMPQYLHKLSFQQFNLSNSNLKSMHGLHENLLNFSFNKMQSKNYIKNLMGAYMNYDQYLKDEAFKRKVSITELNKRINFAKNNGNSALTKMTRLHDNYKKSVLTDMRKVVHLTYVKTNCGIKKFKLPKQRGLNLFELDYFLAKKNRYYFYTRRQLLKRKKRKKIKFSKIGILRIKFLPKNSFITISDSITNQVRTAYTARMIYKTKYGIGSKKQSEARHSKYSRNAHLTTTKETMSKAYGKMNTEIRREKFLGSLFLQTFWHLNHTYNYRLVDIEIQGLSKRRILKSKNIFKKINFKIFKGQVRTISFIKSKAHGFMRQKKARRL